MTPPVLAQVWAAVLLALAWWNGALGGSRRPWARARAFAGRVGLPAEAVDADLVRRIVRRQRFVQGGIALGAAAAYQVGDEWLASGLPWTCLYAGLAVGAVADQLTAPPAPPGTPRVAHPTRAGVAGYVPGWLLGVAGLAALGPAVLAGLWLAARVDPGPGFVTVVPDGAVVAAAGLSVAGLAASLALARLVVRRRQTARSGLELAVDDAFRAQAVRDALHLTAAVSVATAVTLTTVFTQPMLAGDLPDGTARQVFDRVPVGVLAAVVVLLLAHEVFGGPTHWRRRRVTA